MEIFATKLHGMIIVAASFEERVSTERRLRFYWENAREYAKEQFPNVGEIFPTDECTPVVISNYREPYAGTWTFYIEDEGREIFKKMADDFEEKKLKGSEQPDKLDNLKAPKKRKETES